MMTLDLFADDLVCAPPAPTIVLEAPVARDPEPERLAYVMEPAGLNRWTYKGELVMYDMAKHAVPGRGRWSTIESVGKRVIRGHSHMDVCRAIDARQEGSA